jgi:hypothetical protein
MDIGLPIYHKNVNKVPRNTLVNYLKINKLGSGIFLTSTQ